MAIQFNKEVWSRLLHRTKKTAAEAAEAGLKEFERWTFF